MIGLVSNQFELLICSGRNKDGRSSKASSVSISQEMNRYIPDAFFNKKDSTKTHTSLIDLLNQQEV